MEGYKFDPDVSITKRGVGFTYSKPGLYPEHKLFDEESMLPSPLTDPPEILEKKIRFINEVNMVIDLAKAGLINLDYEEL